MIRIEAAKDYPVSAEQGFAYITDPRNWRAYWPGLIDLREPVSWERPGDEAQLDLRIAGRRTRMHMTLDELRPARLVAYRSRQRGAPDARHERHFEPAPTGFRYRVVVAYEPRPGVAGLLDRTLTRWAVRSALRRTLRNLAEPLR